MKKLKISYIVGMSIFTGMLFSAFIFGYISFNYNDLRDVTANHINGADSFINIFKIASIYTYLFLFITGTKQLDFNLKKEFFVTFFTNVYNNISSNSYTSKQIATLAISILLLLFIVIFSLIYFISLLVFVIKTFVKKGFITGTLLSLLYIWFIINYLMIYSDFITFIKLEKFFKLLNIVFITNFVFVVILAIGAKIEVKKREYRAKKIKEKDLDL